MAYNIYLSTMNTLLYPYCIQQLAMKYTYLSREFTQDMSCACATVVAEWWWYPAQLVNIVNLTFLFESMPSKAE